LLDLFAPASHILNYVFSKYAWILGHPNAVSVHVRTYNKEYHETTVRFLGMDYYKKAMEFFPKDSLFVIFSDRINWCRRHFPSDRCVFIGGNNHIQDFFLMSLLKNHIISNSCYSWWAAYMCNHPDKIVVAPENSGRSNDDIIRENINLPDWNLISFELEETYPADMKDYDLYSKSIDTQ
jgi:hypothetical protein